ncbi:hypothetical protein HDU84_002953 [Entophlyctis sp. JEL0112]|nr:hypothetical protein HDU84_002953 [Entophlyctis sp. JEL0112]
MSSVVSPDLSGSGNGSASTSIGVIGLDGDDSIGCASGGDNTLIADDDCAALSPTTIGDIHSAPDGASDLASTIRLQAQQSDKTNQSEIESGSHTLTNGLGLSGGESEQTANVSSSDGPTLSATSPSNNVSRYLSSRKSTPSLHPSQSSIHQQQLMQQQQQQRMQNQLASFPQASTQHYHAYDSQNMVLQQTHLATQTQYPPQAFRSQQQSFLPTGIAHPAYASQPPYLNTPFIQYPNPTPFAYGQVQAPLSQTSHIGGPNQIPFIPQHHPQQLPKPQTHIQSQQPPQQAWFFGGMLPAAKKKPSRRGKKKAKSGLRSDSANTALTNGTTATNSSAGSVIEGSSVEGAHPGDKLGSFAESGQGEEASTEKEDIQLDRSDSSLPQSIALATPAADVVKAPASVDNHNHHHHAENAANADFRQLVSPSSSSSFQDHRRLNSDSPSPLPKSQLQAQLQLQQPRHALPPKPFSPSAGRLSSTSETIRVTPGLDLQRQDSTPSLELQTHPRGMTIVNAAAGAAGNTNISTPVTAGVTATKKVVKAVSVTRSKIAAPAGPYFRLGDLYTWAKNRIVESGELEDDTSVEDVMDALAEAVGFSKISSEGPWSLLRCLGSELFAIGGSYFDLGLFSRAVLSRGSLFPGTSDSDNRRHLLIPEPLALRASQVIADFIYEQTQIQMTMLRTPAKPVSRPKISAITSRSYAHAAATTVNSNGVAAAAAVAPANETDLFGSAQLPSFADVIGVRVTSFDDYAAIAKALEKHRKETARIERDARESLLLKTKLAEAARVVANAPDDGTVFVSLDIEAYERDQAKILEIGWTMYNPRSTGSALIAKHFVCEENAGLANGKFVPNNRHQFRFGETEVESLDYIIDLLKVDMNIDPSADGDAYAQPAVLVGHSVSADIGWLRTCGVFIDSTAYDCFDEEVEDGRDDEVGHGPQQHQQHSPPKSPVIGPTSENIALPNQHHNIKFIFDTADLDCGLHGRLRAQKFSVKKMCSGLGIIDDESDIPFHNAGNDAYLTMQAFLKMATLSHDFNTLAK